MLARSRPSLRIPTIAVLAAIGAIVSGRLLRRERRHRLAGPGARRHRGRVRRDRLLRLLAGALSRAKGNEPGSSEADAANALIIGFAAAGIVLAAACLFIPPVSLLALAALAYLAFSRRRKADEKYEGLLYP